MMHHTLECPSRSMERERKKKERERDENSTFLWRHKCKKVNVYYEKILDVCLPSITVLSFHYHKEEVTLSFKKYHLRD